MLQADFIPCFIRFYFTFMDMRILSFSLIVCLLPFISRGQINEDFTDGDFTQDPAWIGDSAYWQVKDGKLQSNFPGEDAVAGLFFHLSTACLRVKNTVWSFQVQLHFNTSKNNYTDVYLVSDQADPECGLGKCHITHGYFVRIGGTPDEVSLYRRDSISDTLLINGRDGITARSNNILFIKVTCDDKNNWKLYTDESGSGNKYVYEGTAADSTYSQNSFFSIVVHQRGKTAAKKHFFDHIMVSCFIPDTTHPFVKEVYPDDPHHIDLKFSEPVSSSAENILHYLGNGDLNFPDSVWLDKQDQKLAHLFFKKKIAEKKTYHLQLHSIADLSGNEMDSTITFIYYEPKAYEVIMDELFPDPEPSQGLPEHEFIEIRNNSSYPVNLNKWQLCDRGTCSVFHPLIIHPDSFLIVCDKKYQAEFLKDGKTAGLAGLISLNNNEDEVVLKNDKGAVIHSVAYDKSWYKNGEKAAGGWSLEMKDHRYPCLAANNWMAATDPLGGTPGSENSVAVISEDAPPLNLEYVEIMDSLNIIAHFNAGLDSASFSYPAYYLLNNNSISFVKMKPPLFDEVQLHLSQSLQKRKVYTLAVHGLEGCGLKTGVEDHVRFGLAEKADSLDVIINEILFNPYPGGHDFIELYNRSTKIIDVSKLQLANRDKNGNIFSMKPITSVSYYLFPKGYTVITTDREDLLKRYFCKDPGAIIQANDMPAYPNEKGAVLLINFSDRIIDEVDYAEKEQFRLFHQEKGVSLERIDPGGNSNDPANWHSASSMVGYATPAYLNSQNEQSDSLAKAFSVKPEIFSPDGDGLDDRVVISWSLPPGMLGKISVYNGFGLLVRQLLSEGLLGAHGKLFWNGKNDHSGILPTGIYVIYVEVFDLQGNVRHIKLPVVLAKRKR